jgi:outer membrane protein TolC
MRAVVWLQGSRLRLLRQQSVLNYQAAVADAVFEVQSAYFAVLLAAQQIQVRQASVELLEQELADTTRRFEAGTVPRFNVLRAEVELANARPALIRTRNAHRIAKDQLATLLGFDAPREATGDIPLILSGKLEALPWTLPLPDVISTALSRRTELEALRKAQALRWEDVVSAKARYRPSLQAFAGYEARSTIFSPNLAHEVHGWTTGVQLSWDIFDGGLTRGRVKEAEAQYRRSSVELNDAGRQVELEARSAHSAFVEAQEVLQSQEKVLEAAEESLRLARARYEAGTSTQLDVLGAQTALTEARTTQVQALHGYAVARARLERATGLNLPSGFVETPAER